MKNSIPFLFIGLISLWLTSCVSARGGGVGGYETYKSSYSGKSSNLKNSSAALASNKNTTSEFGFFVGVAFNDIVEFGEKLELQPEVKLILIKDLNQLQVPILVKYEVIDKLSALAGPSFGYLLDAPNGIKSFNFGAELGASYDITDKILVTTAYNLGLSNLLENSPSGISVRFSNIQFGVGYRF